MTWKIRYLDAAKKDIKKLDHSVRVRVLRGIDRVSENPLPINEGGYGKPLGKKGDTNLTHLYQTYTDMASP